MDVLSDVLHAIRLSGAVFFRADFGARYCVASPAPEGVSRFVLGGASCLAYFHVLAEGRAWVEREGEPPLALEAGDAILVPQGRAHRLCSEPGLEPVAAETLLPPPPWDLPLRSLNGAARPGVGSASFVCGFLGGARPFAPLLAALPALIRLGRVGGRPSLEVRGEGGPGRVALPRDAGIWLEATTQQMVRETDGRHPGRGALLARLAELLFVETLRQTLEHLPGERGWLAGLADRHVSRALELLHAEPGRTWSVEDLARATGVSRSVLAERFTRLLGESPGRYLARWRMQVARRLLAEDDVAIGEVAARVGYQSEAAFYRAFKRETGQPPATWRRGAAAF